MDDETKLTLHGLQQHYFKLQENEKNRKLNDLLDSLEFNQVCVFVKSVSRAVELNKLLVECNFPSICIHSGMSQEERFVFFYFIHHPAYAFLLRLLLELSATSRSRISKSELWSRRMFLVVALTLSA